MFSEPPRISRPKLPSGRRTIVISDIHGNLPYFKALLEKINFSDQDLLILDGDFLEKGSDSLGTLRLIMKLSERGNVYPILGNCDEWPVVFRRGKDGDAHMQHYLRKRRYGIVYEMLLRMGIDPVGTDNLSDIYPHITLSLSMPGSMDPYHLRKTAQMNWYPEMLSSGKDSISTNGSSQGTGRLSFIMKISYVQTRSLMQNITSLQSTADVFSKMTGSSMRLSFLIFHVLMPLPFLSWHMIPSRQQRC